MFEDDVNYDAVLEAVRREMEELRERRRIRGIYGSMPFSRAYKVVHQHVDANDYNSFERH